MRLAFALISLALSVFCLSLKAQASASWTIKKEAWTVGDEKNYSAFIAALGASGCNTVDKCLKNPANPYRASDPADAYFDADCAKFPYLLRGYFAWKNNLPFSYANGVSSADGQGGDLRYSPNGNKITSRRDLVVSQSGQRIDGYRALRTMQNEVDTGMFRIHPNRDGVERGKFQDFYAVKIDRAEVRPGTVIYDPAGHVVVVFKVETDGRVRYFDAHPDKTVSHGVYGEKFARSRPGMGAGFKNFRSLKLVGGSRSSDGFVGGHITSTPIAQTPGFSVEEFFGTENSNPSRDEDWRKARFKLAGVEMSYFDFVRARLAVGVLKYHPVEELTNAMDALCGDIKDRGIAVQTSIAANINDKPHPDHLPNNIYGTSGEWEEFSTPSRDARLKTSFVEIRQRVEQMVEMYRRNDPRVEYPGHDLGRDLRDAYEKQAAACTIQYSRSNGQTVQLGYDVIVSRLFGLSFDPYNCPELRWGAIDASELSTCRDSNDKFAWYHAEQRLRNQIERPYDTKMSFSLKDLQNAVPGSGVSQAPGVDLRGYLNSL
jgi:hypothetical protein